MGSRSAEIEVYSNVNNQHIIPLIMKHQKIIENNPHIISDLIIIEKIIENEPSLNNQQLKSHTFGIFKYETFSAVIRPSNTGKIQLFIKEHDSEYYLPARS